MPITIVLVTFSLSINASEQQTTDTAKTLTDKDRSNSMDDQQNIKMFVKNEPSAASSDNSNFTSIFDGKTLDGWKMAGDGRFVIVGLDASSSVRRRDGVVVVYEKQLQELYIQTRMESIR